MPYPWTAGDTLTATDLNDAFGGDWTDWSSSFSITAATTAPTKGSGTTYEVYYKKTPDLVYMDFTITIGTGWSSGSGEYRFALPYEAASINFTGAAMVIDASVPTFWPSVMQIYFADHAKFVIYRAIDSSPTAAAIGSSSVTWASGDVIRGSVVYRPV